MPKFPRNRAGPLNLLLHQPWCMLCMRRRVGRVVDGVGILTKAGALSIRSDSRGNKDPYSEGVSHLLTPIKVQKGFPLSLGDHFHPKSYFTRILFRIPKGRFKFSKNLEKPHFTLLNTCINWRTQKSTLFKLALPWLARGGAKKKCFQNWPPPW